MKKILRITLATALISGGLMLGASDEVRQAQEALKAKGFDPGPIDGIYGPLTKAAVRQYQEQNKIVANGRLGGETYTSLGVDRSKPAKEMGAAGSDLKTSYSSGGKDIGQGTKDMGSSIKHGQVTDAAKDLGTGVGRGAKKIGVGTGKAAVHAVKGVKDSLTPHDKQ